MTGVGVDWRGFYANEQRRRTVLPTYPFERKRYWPEAVQKAITLGPTTELPKPVCGICSFPTRVADSPIPVHERSCFYTQGSAGGSRKERLLVEVRGLMQELSGYDLSTVEPSTDLLELGLDSLLLTQAAQLIQRKFEVQITFRQLMEEVEAPARRHCFTRGCDPTS